MIAEAGTALTSLKTAMDMLKGVRALKSEADINEAVIDIQRLLLDTQAAALADKERQFALVDRISKLETQLAAKLRWENEKQRYQLTEFSTGRYAFVLKDNLSGGEPAHKLCAKCFTDDRKSILQTANKHSGGESVYCQHCKEKTTLSTFPPAKTSTAPRSSWIDSRGF
jgi:hypothetical protein